MRKEYHSRAKLVNCKQILSHVSDQTAVDPGFPRGRGAIPKGALIYYLVIFFRKLNEIEENWT